jgi:hypothetical protein
MHRKPAVLALVVSTFCAGTALAQDRPNLAGRWIPAGAGSQPEQPVIVSQTPTSLTVQNWSKIGPSSGTYQLGPEPQQPAATTPGAFWNGYTLVVTFAMSALPNAPAGSAVRTESWSLDRTGKLTVLIEVRPNQGSRELNRFIYSRADQR